MSPRQTEIYFELISGKSYKEISELLFISTETVKSHSRAVYQHFGVKDQKKLMALILQMPTHLETFKKNSFNSASDQR